MDDRNYFKISLYKPVYADAVLIFCEVIENLKIHRALHFFMSSLMGRRKEHNGVAYLMVIHLSLGNRAEAGLN